MTNAEDTSRSDSASRLWVERSTAIGLLIVAATIFLGSDALVSDASGMQRQTIGPETMLLIGSTLVGLTSALWLIKSLKDRRVSAEAAGELPPMVEVILPFGILMISVMLIPWLGLLGSVIVAYIGLLLFYRDFSWIFILLSSTAYVLVIHFGLEVALRVPLPNSPILPNPF